MRKTVWKRVVFLLAFACLGAAAYFCGKLLQAKREYAQCDLRYENMAREVGMIWTGEASGIETELEVSVIENPSRSGVNFQALAEMSGEISAWLYCPGTAINYPVTQGADNEFYLSHLADGTENLCGSLFIDCDNRDDFTDKNTLIYGHNMGNGSMFACLTEYEFQEYYEEHPVMYLLLAEESYRVELFAGYATTVDSAAYERWFADKSGYEKWISQISGESDFATEVRPTAEDRIVTFSTCAGASRDGRYVVQGRLVAI